jgi:hypothetical protein
MYVIINSITSRSPKYGQTRKFLQVWGFGAKNGTEQISQK